MEVAEILKRAKTDANCYETEKHKATVAVENTTKSKCDLDPVSIRRKHFKPSARGPVLPHQLSI